MDCADEAALVRHALNRPGVRALNFDLVGRRVDVSFDPGTISAAAIVDAVKATGLTAHTHAAGDRVGDDHAEHGNRHDTARWWAVASGAALLAGWFVHVVYAGSWTEAVFGNHSESGHSHHPGAVVAYAVSEHRRDANFGKRSVAEYLAKKIGEKMRNDEKMFPKRQEIER